MIENIAETPVKSVPIAKISEKTEAAMLSVSTIRHDCSDKEGKLLSLKIEKRITISMPIRTYFAIIRRKLIRYMIDMRTSCIKNDCFKI